ncbi:MAG: glycosyltransferase family 2 protein, partial [Candidatus Kapabacteria bacterium]|nr:glycosyltransferase family 2 protein [Candidatus Kapabacteria bacterium]
MKISVIIVTKDRKEDLRVTLAGFLAQTYKNFEIIIVDNASKDGTREMIQSEYQQVKYLWLPDNFDIRSINIGVEMSDGDIIWRTDSDSHPETEHEFQKVVDVFTAHENIDIISMEEVQVRKGNLVWTWYPHPHDK